MEVGPDSRLGGTEEKRWWTVGAGKRKHTCNVSSKSSANSGLFQFICSAFMSHFPLQSTEHPPSCGFLWCSLDAWWLFRLSRKGTRAWALELSGRPKNSFRIINYDLSQTHQNPPLGYKDCGKNMVEGVPKLRPETWAYEVSECMHKCKVADTKFGQILSTSLSLSVRVIQLSMSYFG